MKQRNIIIIIVGIVLLGLLLISGTTNLTPGSLNHDESQNVEQPQTIDNNPQIFQNHMENKEHSIEDSLPNANDLSKSDDSNST